MRTIFAGRRAAQTRPAGPVGRLFTPWLAALLFLAAVGCATVRPAAEADPALSGSVLAACTGGDESLCRGFLESTASLTFADERACPPPVDYATVKSLALEALREVDPESVAAVPIRERLAKEWPCAATPRIDESAAAFASALGLLPPLEVSAAITAAESAA